MATAVYTRNRLPTSRHPETTPMQSLTGKRSTHKHFKIFGALAYPHDKRYRKALAPTSEVGIFMGYDGSGYVIWIPARKHFLSSGHACKVDESTVTKAGRQQAYNSFYHNQPGVKVKQSVTAKNVTWDFQDISDIFPEAIINPFSQPTNQGPSLLEPELQAAPLHPFNAVAATPPRPIAPGSYATPTIVGQVPNPQAPPAPPQFAPPPARARAQQLRGGLSREARALHPEGGDHDEVWGDGERELVPGAPRASGSPRRPCRRARQPPRADPQEGVLRASRAAWR